jgi:hypothetical protein
MDMIKIVATEVDITLEGKIASDGPREGLFNPTTYSVAKTTEWKETPIRGYNAPALQFDRGASKVVSMSLLFDTFEAGKDVRSGENGTDNLARLAEVIDSSKPQKDRPPLIELFWGDKAIGSPQPCSWVLTSYTLRFTLFAPVGGGVVPVRAVADVSFKEYVPRKTQAKNPPRSSPDKAKLHTVVEGDTLWGLAAIEYGDPTKWRPIADANQIRDPRTLETGRQILIPALE